MHYYLKFSFEDNLFSKSDSVINNTIRGSEVTHRGIYVKLLLLQLHHCCIIYKAIIFYFALLSENPIWRFFNQNSHNQ